MRLTTKNLFTFSNESLTSIYSPERQALLDAGCQSNWVVLAVKDHPNEGKKLVSLYQEVNKLTKGNDKGESEYDAYCNSWYGQNDSDKLKLIKDTTTALIKLKSKYSH